MVVNIGAFLGKTFAAPIRINIGIKQINYFSGIMTFLALVIVYFFYKNFNNTGGGRLWAPWLLR